MKYSYVMISVSLKEQVLSIHFSMQTNSFPSKLFANLSTLFKKMHQISWYHFTDNEHFELFHKILEQEFPIRKKKNETK